MFEKYIDSSPVTHIPGFPSSPKKRSMVMPTQKIEYLGFVLSSVGMTVGLTDKKVHAIVKRCREFLRENKEHPIREVASLIGTLMSTFPGSSSVLCITVPLNMTE